MKANELMIGDWVEYRLTGWTEKGGVYKDYQYVQISTIGELYIKADNDRVASADGEDFFPIPLTPEILEKNGMILSLYGEYFPEDEHYDFEISVVEGRIFWTINAHEYDIMCLRFVHELQHALRLCGIDKEIVL